MTTIYDAENGYTITSGLQSQDVCDEAIDLAMSIAAERGESVILEDEGKLWLVEEDGEVSRISYRDAGFTRGESVILDDGQIWLVEDDGKEEN